MHNTCHWSYNMWTKGQTDRLTIYNTSVKIGPDSQTQSPTPCSLTRLVNFFIASKRSLHCSRISVILLDKLISIWHCVGVDRAANISGKDIHVFQCEKQISLEKLYMYFILSSKYLCKKRTCITANISGTDIHVFPTQHTCSSYTVLVSPEQQIKSKTDVVKTGFIAKSDGIYLEDNPTGHTQTSEVHILYDYHWQNAWKQHDTHSVKDY